MAENINPGKNQIEINPNEILIFQNMLNNFGNEMKKVKTNYNKISHSKLIFVLFQIYLLYKLFNKLFSL